VRWKRHRHRIGQPDRTVVRARAAKAEIMETGLGLGVATRTAFTVAGQHAFVMLDGDLGAVNTAAVTQLGQVAADGGMGRGVHNTAGRSSQQLTRLASDVGVALPPIEPQGLTTSYTSWPERFTDQVDTWTLLDGRGGDLWLAVTRWRAGYQLVAVNVGPRAHTRRDEAHIDTLVAGDRATLERLARQQT
jgi:hypothetical protein